MASVLRHVVTVGDRWDLLAWRYYGDATRFAEIIAANDNIPIVAALLPGAVLSIPILGPSPTPAQQLPPWTAAALAAGDLQ